MQIKQREQSAHAAVYTIFTYAQPDQHCLVQRVKHQPIYRGGYQI